MSDKTKEEVYDEEIAPLMTQIIAICKEHKINTHATFLLDEDGAVTTNLKLDGDPLTLQLLYLSAYCHNNIDSLFISLARSMNEGRFRNESSMVMSGLGVAPPLPTKDAS
jgi:hypothetical protein